MKIADTGANKPIAAPSGKAGGNAGVRDNQGPQNTANTVATPAPAPVKPQPAPEPSAQVAISSAAASLLQGAAEEQSFDAEKVQRISQAISEGKFTINAKAIADKLISNAEELVARQNSH